MLKLILILLLSSTYSLTVIEAHAAAANFSKHGSNSSATQATFYFQNDKPHLEVGVLDQVGGVAVATFNDSIEETGWSVLNIKSGYGDKKSKDTDILYAAGYLEGALTAKRIYQMVVNMNGTFYDDQKPEVVQKVCDFFASQDKWMRKMIAKNPRVAYWQVMALVVAHIDGLLDGYNAMPYQNIPLDMFAIQTLNSIGDLSDIQYALDPSTIPDWEKMTQHEFSLYIAKSGHCSVLVKVLPGFEDIFMGHSTWFSYSATIRIYKHYNFNVANEAVAAKQTSFSSYPGILESIDDFYLLSSGLVMLQTTNNMYNNTLYKLVVPESLLAWQRVRVANFMAHSGKEWADVLAKYNSGTYNNQYMIIDRKRISKEIENNALWVIEQIPGFVQSGDQTPILRAGYWPSYNIPFYEDIYNMSAYPEMKKKRGQQLSYQLASRAEIFRRDQSTVVDMDSYKNILRFNNYKNDPYSYREPCNTICCRGDLRDPPSAGGCYDTKVTNLGMSAKMMSYAISGPTQSSNLPAFEWTDVFTQPH
ncbi:phospholipase B-like 1 [Amphiura filiformis]|uniref:phospholipase B-like 1 n=1 Tax=Amphiura filiformis TaxID=82378 RepID=UPI003B21ED44